MQLQHTPRARRGMPHGDQIAVFRSKQTESLEKRGVKIIQVKKKQRRVHELKRSEFSGPSFFRGEREADKE